MQREKTSDSTETSARSNHTTRKKDQTRQKHQHDQLTQREKKIEPSNHTSRKQMLQNQITQHDEQHAMAQQNRAMDSWGSWAPGLWAPGLWVPGFWAPGVLWGPLGSWALGILGSQALNSLGPWGSPKHRPRKMKTPACWRTPKTQTRTPSPKHRPVCPRMLPRLRHACTLTKHARCPASASN